MILPLYVLEWPEPWRSEYEERAGIMEFDGGLPRAKAERFAERCVRLRAEKAPDILPARRDPSC